MTPTPPTLSLCFGFALFLCACECGSSPPQPPPREPPPVSDYFPAAAGDRWRLQTDRGPQTYGVTAVTDTGVSVFFGTDRVSAERFIASAEEVSLVGADDSPIAPFLASPIVLGHTWNYRLGDTACEAKYESVDETIELAGLTLDACIKVKRTCLHPGGKPFREPTTETHQEVYCPKVGRVAERIRLDPAPIVDGTSIAAERTSRVTRYRVGGSPAPPAAAAFDCDSFLLMPTDVQAACGPNFRMESAAGLANGNACTYRFTAPTGSISVTAARAGNPPDDGPLLSVEEGDNTAWISGDDVCPPARLRRLGPTIQSLLRL